MAQQNRPGQSGQGSESPNQPSQGGQSRNQPGGQSRNEPGSGQENIRGGATAEGDEFEDVETDEDEAMEGEFTGEVGSEGGSPGGRQRQSPERERGMDDMSRGSEREPMGGGSRGGRGGQER
jgi:hypothetical protein